MKRMVFIILICANALFGCAEEKDSSYKCPEYGERGMVIGGIVQPVIPPITYTQFRCGNMHTWTTKDQTEGTGATKDGLIIHRQNTEPAKTDNVYYFVYAKQGKTILRVDESGNIEMSPDAIKQIKEIKDNEAITTDTANGSFAHLRVSRSNSDK